MPRGFVTLSWLSPKQGNFIYDLNNRFHVQIYDVLLVKDQFCHCLGTCLRRKWKGERLRLVVTSCNRIWWLLPNIKPELETSIISSSDNSSMIKEAQMRIHRSIERTHQHQHTCYPIFRVLLSWNNRYPFWHQVEIRARGKMMSTSILSRSESAGKRERESTVRSNNSDSEKGGIRGGEGLF